MYDEDLTFGEFSGYPTQLIFYDWMFHAVQWQTDDQGPKTSKKYNN